MKLLFTASPGKSQVMEQNDKENSILRNKFTHYISNLKRNYIHFLIFLFHPIKRSFYFAFFSLFTLL